MSRSRVWVLADSASGSKGGKGGSILIDPDNRAGGMTIITGQDCFTANGCLTDRHAGNCTFG